MFDVGQPVRIAVFNRAATGLGVDLDALIAALQEYVDRYIVPVWATPATLVRSKGFLRKHWALVFLDDADAPGALAYHDLTPDGLPVSKVFVRTVLSAGERLSVAASHELVEMLVDPAINLWSTGPEPAVMYAYESADPVEETHFPVRGLPMSNFVFPSYFESFRKRGSDRFDAMGLLKRPFQLLPGGYQIVFRNGRFTQVFGSPGKSRRFAREDRRGHRSGIRRGPGIRGRAKARRKRR